MIGGAVGFVTGLAGFLVLKRFAHTVVRKKRSAILLGALQPLIIILGLLCCAFLIPDQILFAGLSTAAIIMGGSIINTIKRIPDEKRSVYGSVEREKEADIQ